MEFYIIIMIIAHIIYVDSNTISMPTADDMTSISSDAFVIDSVLYKSSDTVSFHFSPACLYKHLYLIQIGFSLGEV